MSAEHPARDGAAAGSGGPPGDGPADGELVALVQGLPRGDAQREDACEQLVTRYESLVRSCVARYRDSPEPFDELMQVGYVGLLKAINNFDASFGTSLAAYAQPCVSGEIKRHFRDKRWLVRVRRSVQELRLDIRKASADLTHELSRTPREDELARYLNVTAEQVREAQEASLAFQASSLDAPVGPDEASLGELIGAEDPGLELTEDLEAVRAHWMELPGRERRLLMMRFYGNMTQAQIGDQLGISQMHVSRLLSRALSYLRERITGVPAPAPGGD
jgi:RNA polymerase sigma-B factor